VRFDARSAALGAAAGGIAGGRATARDEEVRAESRDDSARAFATCMIGRGHSARERRLPGIGWSSNVLRALIEEDTE
jgi:hypothetical protein